MPVFEGKGKGVFVLSVLEGGRRFFSAGGENSSRGGRTEKSGGSFLG